GDSQAEIVLRGHLAWGSELPARLGGAFAFAIWDEASSELFLARDRLGLKPLHYVLRERHLLFRSEPKAPVAHPSIAPELDDDGIAALFALQFVRPPGTVPFRGMHELAPAHWLSFGRHGMRIERYWQLRSAPHTDDLETTTATVRRLFEESVRRRL